MNRTARPLTFAGVTLRNLSRHPVRTFLTALGVSVGVVAVVTLSSISNGFWHMTQNVLHMGGTDLMVFQANQASDILSTLDEQKTLAALKSVDAVAEAAGLLWSVQRAGDHPFLFAVGVRMEQYPFERLKIGKGRKPNGPEDVLIGRVAARTLNANPEEKVTIGGREFTVAGIFESGIVILDGGMIVDLDVLQNLAKREGQITAVQVQLRPGVSVDDAIKAIESRNPELVAIGNASDYTKVDRGLVIMRALVWAVSMVAVVIGAVVVLNTMWMAVFERTREIGILRALGWSRGSVVRMVLIESALIGLLSAVLGSLLGVGLAEATKMMRFTEQFVNPTYDVGTFALAGAISLVIGALGGVIPSWRASTFSPAEALRYE